MYLSRLILNPRSREVRRDLGDCHALHRTLLRAFPEKKGAAVGARAEFGLLYRLEVDPRRGLLRVYAQSATLPDWGVLPPGYLEENPGTPNPACKDVRPLYSRIRAGSILVFSLHANPTRKVGTALKTERLSGQGSNGRRVFLTRPEEQTDWLHRKGAAGGFRVLAVTCAPQLADLDAIPTGRWRGSRGDNQLTLDGCMYRGRLQVTEPERFLESMAKGVGAGKAYGFGLLLVAPAAPGREVGCRA